MYTFSHRLTHSLIQVFFRSDLYRYVRNARTYENKRFWELILIYKATCKNMWIKINKHPFHPKPSHTPKFVMHKI